MIGLEAGYGTYNLLGKQSQIGQNMEEDYTLYELRPSILYILNPKNKKTKTFLSAELFYINQKDQFINNSEELKNDRYINNSSNLTNSYLRYDQADYSRQKYGLNLNFGILVDLWGHFGFNLNCGLGIRNRKITYSNVINPEAFRPPSLDEDNHYVFAFPTHLSETGNRIGANVNVDFKLIYKL